VDIFGCENPGIYVKMGVSVIERRNRFRKVKNFSAMYPVIQLSLYRNKEHIAWKFRFRGSNVQMWYSFRCTTRVNEDSGDRRFGGCLNAGMGLRIRITNRMVTSEQRIRTPMEPIAWEFAYAKQLAYVITLTCYHIMHN